MRADTEKEREENHLCVASRCLIGDVGGGNQAHGKGEFLCSGAFLVVPQGFEQACFDHDL